MGCGDSRLKKTFSKLEYGFDLNPKNNEIFKNREKTIPLPNGEIYSYYDIDSYDLFNCEKNSTIPILIIHDFSFSKEIFKTLIEALIKLGFRCIVPDLKGHGKSTYHNPLRNFEDFITDLKFLGDLLQISKFHSVIGWGLGGAIALKMAINDSKYINKIVLLNSIPINGLGINNIKSKNGVEGIGEIRKIKSFIINKNKEDIKDFIYENIFNKKGKPIKQSLIDVQNAILNFKCPIDAYWEMINFKLTDKHETEENIELNKIKSPLLILHGNEDIKINNKLIKDQIEYIEKNSSLKYENYIYENSGHFVVCDNYDDVVKKIKIFLKC